MPLFSPALNALSPFASMRGDHVGLRVPNLDEALAWYGEKLDFRIVGSSETNGLLYTLIAPANDDVFRLELMAGPGIVQRTGSSEDLAGSLSVSGFNHVCLRIDGVDEMVAELKRRDVRFLLDPTDSEELQARVAFFADPWGNVFELWESKSA